MTDFTTITSDNIVDFITDIFTRKGADSYLGEAVTMAQHMLQSAYLAEQNSDDEALICAALLHDIGHYTGEFPADMIAKGLDNYHQISGARILAPFFCDKIIACIQNHVDAKRYLCAIDHQYYDQLSQASKDTLKLQGGPMTEQESNHFSALRYLDEIVQVRRWDDLAKDPDITTPTFAHYRPLLERQVQTRQA